MPRFNCVRKLVGCFGQCSSMPKKTSPAILPSSENGKACYGATFGSSVEEKGTVVEKDNQSVEEKGAIVEKDNQNDYSQETFGSPIKEQRTMIENERDCSDYGTKSLLPLDVVLEILSRLPVKPLLRCKCVCKSWRAAIQERSFVEKHTGCHNSVYVFKNEAARCVHHHVWEGLALEENKLTKQFSLVNPSTGQRVRIPDPHKEIKHIHFTYIQATGSYKLIQVHKNVGTELAGCKVLALGTDPTWRSVNIPRLQSIDYARECSLSTVIGEVFFLTRFRADDGLGVSIIIYLEMASEKFGYIKPPLITLKNEKFGYIKPPLITLKKGTSSLVRWENKLALADRVGEELHFWILEDYKKQKWAESKKTIPLTFLSKYPTLPTNLLPYSVTDGWLQFFLHKGRHVEYHIPSKEVSIFSAPPGQQFACRVLTSIARIPEIDKGTN